MPMNIALKIAIVESTRPAADIAEEAGLHESKLSKIVNGRREPSKAERAAIARALKRKPAELFPEAIAS
jgi:transcriptional regulator with XRE-family HTH domain